ncbi:MAG TPA: hypothetical protein VIM12_19385 [Noviherbaspirillum sp.]|jgi:hypothetical protein|uniref:hypothetical protein n=1 Tax=Noviherbaspirillum sp. TaxID=1926288 RepID=UPI002F944671
MTGIPAGPLRAGLALLAALTGLLAAPAGQADELRISGLLPFENAASGSAVPVVRDGVLDIPLADRNLRIRPWPARLPQEFREQVVEARRHASPAGPSDRITMHLVDNPRPWLELAAGARQSTPVVGGWRLQHNMRGWWLSQGTKLHFLGKDAGDARAVQVPAGMERWCVHLLDASNPAPSPGGAGEQEAQAAWAAVRMEAGRRCRAGGKAGTQPSWRKVEGVGGGAP